MLESVKSSVLSAKKPPTILTAFTLLRFFAVLRSWVSKIASASPRLRVASFLRAATIGADGGADAAAAWTQEPAAAAAAAASSASALPEPKPCFSRCQRLRWLIVATTSAAALASRSSFSRACGAGHRGGMGGA